MKDYLNKELEGICKNNRLTGANVVLFDSEGIVYTYNYGYANKEQQLKSTNDSLYMIGSNTKVMTAVCILKLMEDGMLSLDDDVRKFIPEFEVKATFDYDKITIKNLLMHRSGLVGDFYHMIVDRSGDFHDVIGEIKNTYLTSVPGTMFAYSNVGYTVLGIVIERASGLTYQECIDKTIAQPLGINIHFLQTEKERAAFSKTISLCYNRKGKAVEDLLYTMLPAGSNTYMSISDFAKFGQIFLRKDGTVLKKDTLALMESLDYSEVIDHELTNAGYGLLHNFCHFGQNVGKVYGHGGDTVYHHSAFYYIPDQNLGVAVFTNNEQGTSVKGALSNKAVLSYLNHKGISTATYPLLHHHICADCSQYEGKYATALGICDIRKNQLGALTAKIKGQSLELKLCEDGFFQLCPKSLPLQLPKIKGQIQRFRIKITEYADKKVLILEERYTDNYTRSIIGCLYEETDIPESFRKACGRYEIANANLKGLVKRGMNASCALVIKKDTLMLQMHLLKSKGSVHLKAMGDQLAFVQGFGRGTRHDVSLWEENGVQYLKCCGLIFKKVSK